MRKTSKKILVDAYLLNKEPQGTKTYIKELYKEFATKNPKVNIFFGCFKDEALQKEFANYENIHFLHYKHQNRFVRMLFEIPKLIKKHQFTHAHFQYVIPFFRSNSCKYIVTIHDILFNNFKNYFSASYRKKRNFLFKYSAKKCDYLVTVSNYSKEEIQQQYKLQNKNIYVTPNGVNANFLEDYNKEDAVKYIKNNYGINNYILYVSRIEPRKNQQLVLESFLQQKDKNLQLLFIGDKTLKNQELNNLINNLPLNKKNRIYFLNGIKNKDLLYFYKASRVFVYPSLAEGFGIPPIEAGALKIPVLCSNQTAMQDFYFFKPYFTSPKNKEEFTQLLTLLLHNKNTDRLDTIQQKIKELYTWKNAAKVLDTIVHEAS